MKTLENSFGFRDWIKFLRKSELKSTQTAGTSKILLRFQKLFSQRVKFLLSICDKICFQVQFIRIEITICAMAKSRCGNHSKLVRRLAPAPSSTEDFPDQFEYSLKSALNVIISSISNSEDLLKFCESYQRKEGNQMLPGIKQYIQRTVDETQAILKLKEKITKVKVSLGVRDEKETKRDFEDVKRDFNNMISKTEGISREKLKMFSDLLSLTEAIAMLSKLPDVYHEQNLDEVPIESSNEDSLKFPRQLLSAAGQKPPGRRSMSANLPIPIPRGPMGVKKPMPTSNW